MQNHVQKGLHSCCVDRLIFGIDATISLLALIRPALPLQRGTITVSCNSEVAVIKALRFTLLRQDLRLTMFVLACS